MLLVTACGFAPIYGQKSAGGGHSYAPAAVLAQIDIDNIPDREGQFLRNALIDRFHQNGRPDHHLYKLQVSEIQENKTDLDITEDADTTRAELRLSTTIQLIRQDTGQKLLERRLKSIASYNILGSQFTTRVSEQNARDAAITDLARQIELQLGLYLNR